MTNVLQHPTDAQGKYALWPVDILIDEQRASALAQYEIPRRINLPKHAAPLPSPRRRRRTSIGRAIRLAKREGVDVVMDRSGDAITFRPSAPPCEQPDASPNPWDEALT